MSRISKDEFALLWRNYWPGNINDPLCVDLSTRGLCSIASRHPDGQGCNWMTTGNGQAAIRSYLKNTDAARGFYHMAPEDALTLAYQSFEYSLAVADVPADENGRPDESELSDEDRKSLLERNRSIAFEAMRLMVTPRLDPQKAAALRGTPERILQKLIEDWEDSQ